MDDEYGPVYEPLPLVGSNTARNFSGKDILQSTSPMESMFLDAIPDVCLTKNVREYLGMLKTVTESPDTYHLVCLLASIGCVLGRSVWRVQGKPLYPNLYILLLGKTGACKKSTAAGTAIDIVAEVRPTIKRLENISTGEGLLQELATAEITDRQELNDLLMRGIQPNRPGILLHRRTILFEDELSALLSKAQNSSSGTLVKRLTSAYDCRPTLEHNTKSRPLVAEKPTLTFISCSTESWLQKTATVSDVHGGLFNRFLFVDGFPKPALPFTDPKNPDEWRCIVEWVRIITQKYIANPRELPFEPEA